MTMRLEIQAVQTDQKSTASSPALRWSKLSSHHLSCYQDTLDYLLSCGQPEKSEPLCCDNCHCNSTLCQDSIQNEYDFLIQCISTADKTLPRHQKGHEKSWWNEELSRLKQQSIEIQRLWLDHGRPGNGTIHQERLCIRAAYKRAMRKAQKVPNQQSWDKLYSGLETSDSNNFWHSWKTLHNKKGHGVAPVVEGCTSESAIANTFKEAFRKNSEPNDRSKVIELNSRFTRKYADFCKAHANTCDCMDYTISVDHVIDAICGMKAGKCADECRTFP